MAAMTREGYALGIVLSLSLGFVLGHFLWPLTEDMSTEVASAPHPSPTPAAAPVAPAPTPASIASEPPPTEKASDEEFVLKGVFVSANPDHSLALIANSNGTAKLYKPGQKLNDHYSLRSIGEKEVEIEKDGNSKTLPLKRGQSDQEPSSTASTAEATDNTDAFAQWLEENMDEKTDARGHTADTVRQQEQNEKPNPEGSSPAEPAR